MTTLTEHNKAELPMVSRIMANELHLLKEFAIIDESDPDVKWAIEERTIDIIDSGAGAYMASIVD